MFKGIENNCRLCLKRLDNDYNVIEEVTREIFEVILLKLDLSVSKEPIICKTCLESVHEAYNFKSTCISVEEQVFSLAIDRNSVKLDIRDVYLNKNENEAFLFDEAYDVCRFCLQCLEKHNFNLLNDLTLNSIDEMLLKCMPELEVNIIKEPVICAACMKSLESYYSFAMKCRNTEENIMKYFEVQGAETNGQLSLNNVLKFLFERMLETVVPKEEDHMFQSERNTYSDIYHILTIEKEELVIKEEINYENYKAEGNRCCETKGKEIGRNDELTYMESLEKLVLIDKENAKFTVYKCNLCSYETERKQCLKVHMLTHKDSSDTVMFKCALCTFESKYKESLKRHLWIHKNKAEMSMHKCSLCIYEAKWLNSLKKHMLTHKDSSEIIMYKCALCTFETKYKRSLNAHIMVVHKDSSDNKNIKEKRPTYKCTLCTYEAKLERRLKSHMLAHKDSSDVVMFKCALCTFETKYKASLKSHMWIHKNKAEMRTYKCSLCSYEAKRKDNLRRHMLTHMNSSDVVIFRCASCTFATSHKHCLKYHVFTHKKKKAKIPMDKYSNGRINSSDIEMFRCALCTFETKYKQSLKIHMLVHKDSSQRL